MRTRAAVALEAGKPLEIMEVNLEGPKAGEVLVEILLLRSVKVSQALRLVIMLSRFTHRNVASASIV